MGSIVIEDLQPTLDGGRHPVKRVLGEPLRVEADVFKEGHDVLAAVVRWRHHLATGAEGWSERPLLPLGNDRFGAELILPKLGRYAFTVEAWADGFATWVEELNRRLEAGQEVQSELLEGAALLDAAATRAEPVAPAEAQRLRALAAELRGTDPTKARAAAQDPQTRALAARHPDRSVSTRLEPPCEVRVERVQAACAAWYEFFPRSGGGPGHHRSLREAEDVLPAISELGFDVVYLPPIHPIGVTARKGKNNARLAAKGDVGSPWAIGSAAGGHKAVHPELGSLEDFRRFLGRAAEHGLEVALDLAFQCSPDHPYVTAHPEWFHHRPDGSIKTAENPPKRYEDIVNFDFLGPARESLWTELKSVVDHWIAQGVKTFRVDNPHTKPLPFWEWLLRAVLDEHPDVVFLAEAFTRPKVMRALAKVGFSQSYTYFTWRNSKDELRAYLEELTQGPAAEFMRGNLWPNTPDILPEGLQRGGPPAFKIRFALAATLSSVYGIYMGYEWCEARALHGEEYLDSEKYQLASWDFDRPGEIRGFIAAINRARREHPALRHYKTLRFHEADNDRVLFYGKQTPEGEDPLLIAVSLDPFEPQETTLQLPTAALGLAPNEACEATELLSGQKVLWQGKSATIRLTPQAPAAIWSLRRFSRREAAFDYF